VNRRFKSGKSGSPLTKKFKRSQSSSPGHLPLHSVLRNHPLITARRLAVLLSLSLLSLGFLKVQPLFS
jgi:hypothetical protein